MSRMLLPLPALSARRAAVLRAYFVPLVAALTVFMPGLWFDRWIWDPGLYTAISLNASREAHWWTLHHANLVYLNKPPLWFWVHAACASVLGEADWVLRLPDLLAALGCVGVLVSLVLRLHGPRAAMAAGLFLALCPDYVRLIPQFRLDMPHALFMLAAVRLIVGGCAARGRGGRAWLIGASGVPIGLALMTKPLFGPAALAIAGVWMLLVGAGPRRRFVWLAGAAAVAVVMAAPWHVSMWRLHGDPFIRTYFNEQALDRATGSQFGAEPWHAYFRYLAGFQARIGGRSAGAWSIPLVACAAAALLWRMSGHRLVRRQSRAGVMLAIVWTGGLLIGLSLFADKKMWYLVPVYPGLAWLAGLAVVRACPRGAFRVFWRVSPALACAALVVVLATRTRFDWGIPQYPPDTGVLANFIREHPGEDYWNGSLRVYENAPLAIRTGVWPKFVEDIATGRRWEVPVGAILLYERKRGQPDPSDEIVLDDGRFVVARRTRPDAPPPPARSFR